MSPLMRFVKFSNLQQVRQCESSACFSSSALGIHRLINCNKSPFLSPDLLSRSTRVLPLSSPFLSLEFSPWRRMASTLNSYGQPIGAASGGPDALSPSASTILGGSPPEYGVRLEGLNEGHFPALWKAVGGKETGSLWTYMMAEPALEYGAFERTMRDVMTNYCAWAIIKTAATADQSEPSVVGIISLLNIVPQHKSVEIGHVLFSPALQRTTAATETCYLLMRHCFEDLHYHRVEWKCNSLNEPSKRAALRLGFTLEGEFRKHMVIKGSRRDSTWFSVLDDEWFQEGKGSVKQALVNWLKPDNFDAAGKQKRKLEDIRDS